MKLVINYFLEIRNTASSNANDSGDYFYVWVGVGTALLITSMILLGVCIYCTLCRKNTRSERQQVNSWSYQTTEEVAHLK